MASTSKRIRVGEPRSEEQSTTIYDVSEPEGMTRGEESEVDPFPTNESNISRYVRTKLSHTKPCSSHAREHVFWNCGKI